MTTKTIPIAGTRDAIERQPLLQLVCNGALAAARLLRRHLSMIEPSALPDDAVKQLRHERLRAQLRHDDLRISVRRVL